MGDKFFLLLLMLIVLAGGVAYERYLTGRDGVSPVARMIDAGGLSSALDWQGRRMTAHQSVYRVQDKIENLQASYHLINEKRAQLSQSRAAVLTQASLLSGQIVAQGEKYKEIITTERQAFSQGNPEFKALLNSLSEALLLSSPDDRAKKYEEAKSRIYDALARVSGHSQAENPLFMGFFGDLEKGLAGDPAWEADCGGRAACVGKITAEFQSQAEDFIGQRLQQSAADINDVLASARALEREEDVFGANLKSSEDRILENNQKMETGVDVLAKELTAVTDARMEALMAAYQSQREEQEIILSNLELSWQRLKAQQEVLGRTVNKVRSGPGIEIGHLSESYEAVLVALHTNLETNRDLMRGHAQETKNFIAFLGGTGGQRAATGAGRDSRNDGRNSEQRDGNAFLRKDTLDRDQPGQRTLNTMVGQPVQSIQPREPLNASRPGINNRNSSDEQMQRLRDQARDQGFYKK